jgi:hypothetical protein
VCVASVRRPFNPIPLRVFGEGQYMSTIDFTEVAVPAQPSTASPANTTKFFADLEQLKVDMKQAGLEGASEQLSAVMVRKPPAEEYIRVHSAPEMTISLALYELKEGYSTEYFIVMPKMLSTMITLRGAFYAQLYVAVTKSGAAMIWPVKLPTGGAGNPWTASAVQGAKLAKESWIRIFADSAKGQYRIMKAMSELGDPTFPDQPLSELLELAFQGRVIDSDDHPVCRKLRGQV